MDIRYDDDDIAEVSGPRSTKKELKQIRDGLWEKNTLSPSLKMPTWSLCSPHSHKELAGH